MEFPNVEKLPEVIYDGTFSLRVLRNVEVFMGKDVGIYYFQDKTWFGDVPHMLGWAREIIHSLETGTIRPNWLNGHAFQLKDNNTYQVSGTATLILVPKLIALAKETQSALEAAGAHTDQWGSSKHEEWLPTIAKHLGEKSAKHPMVKYLHG